MDLKHINLNIFKNYRREYSSYGTKYIVEPHDSLYDIAYRFHTSVEILMELNNLENDLIHPGEIIIVDNLYHPENKPIYKKYTVKKNDTLYSIAYNYGMTSNDILEINNLLDDKILEGEIIYVYNNLPLLSDEIIYTVKPGDSLYSIAQEYNTTVAKIRELNYLTDELLTVGTKLIIVSEEHVLNEVTEIYIVVPNDSLYSIANKKGISIEELKQINNLTSDHLNVGQQLIVPKDNLNGRIS